MRRAQSFGSNDEIGAWSGNFCRVPLTHAAGLAAQRPHADCSADDSSGVAAQDAREEPVHFRFAEGALQPSEQQESGAGERGLAERNAEGELEGGGSPGGLKRRKARSISPRRCA